MPIMSDKYSKKDWYSQSDNAIIKGLGSFVKETRLRKNFTQKYLAEKAGVHRVTLSEFEQGKRGSLTAFIQLLRALNELELLDVFQIRTTISPLQMARLEAHKRHRAFTHRKLTPTMKKKILLLQKSKKRK